MKGGEYLKIDVDVLRRTFEYVEEIDPKSGVLNGGLKRLVKAGRVAAGTVSFGTDNGQRYMSIQMDGKRYTFHRLVYVLHTGTDFKEGQQINHIDKNPSNNLLSNLEVVSGHLEHKTIDQLGRPNRRNKSGCSNIYWETNREKWVVKFTQKGKMKRFLDFDEAVKYRNEVAKQLGAPVYND